MQKRAATLSDLAPLAALFQAINRAEIGRVETDEADMRQILTAPGLDLGRYSCVHEHDGQLLGFAALHAAPHVGQLRAHLGVSPTAPEALADTLLRQIENWAQQHPPSGTQVRVATSDGDRRRLHMVLEDALAGHWNHRRRTFDEFWTDQQQRGGHDPALWWIAEIDGTPVASLIARAQLDRGWIAWLGIEQRFRGRGLGRFLLLTAFAELQERGYPMVGVDVDSANETNALGVYEAVGMRVLGQADQWRRDIGLRRLSPSR
ncbi:GNAT family N-acetyltransferase [Nonomuraea sp. NPDC049152]|uniref:GNAT family N-acetyltransferase n=1 Tax=Nonomuraea sp. NPDC049152 TaxID=3154350 RepID=UPI0033D01CC1